MAPDRPTIVSDAMRGAVGRPFDDRQSYPVAAADIRRWAIAVYFPEPPPRLYWDEVYARSTVHGGIVAPEDFNPFAWATVRPAVAERAAAFDPDFVEHLLGIEGPGLATALNAGIDTEYGVRMRPGDTIRATSQVVDYTEKAGRFGRMLMTTVRSTWTNQRDETVKRSAQTLIRY